MRAPHVSMILFVSISIATGCAASVPGPDGGDDAAVDVSARCASDYHHAGTPACSSAYPAGEMCNTRCAFCQPQRGSGGECVCDGTRWICPGDTGGSLAGCPGVETLYSGNVPGDCH